MTVRDDLTPAGLAADEAVPDAAGFDDLLASSSLGAPHVTALMAPLPTTVGARFTRYLDTGAVGDTADCDTGPSQPAPTPRSPDTDNPDAADEQAVTEHDHGPVLWTRNHDSTPRPRRLLILGPSGVGRATAVRALLEQFLQAREHRYEPAEPVETAPEPLGAAVAGRTRPSKTLLVLPDPCEAHTWPRLRDRRGRDASAPEPLTVALVGCTGSAKTTFLRILFNTLGTADRASMPPEPDALYDAALQVLTTKPSTTGSADSGAFPSRSAALALRALNGRGNPPSAFDARPDTRTLLRHQAAEAADSRPYRRWNSDFLFVFPDVPIASVRSAFPDDWEPEPTANLRYVYGQRPNFAADNRLHDSQPTVKAPLRIFGGHHGPWAPVELPSMPAGPVTAPVVSLTGSDARLVLYTDGILEPHDQSTWPDLALLLDPPHRPLQSLAAPFGTPAADDGYPRSAGTSHRPADTARAARRTGTTKPSPPRRTRHRPGPKSSRPHLHLVTETTDSSTTLRAQVQMHLLVSGEQHVDVPTELAYRSHDPYAIELTFTPAGAPPVKWVIARDLVTDGLTSPAGTGDARIWSDPPGLFTSDDARRVHLSLDSPQGHAHLTMPWADLDRFITATRKIVPPGREHTHVTAAFDDFTATIHTSTPSPRPASRP
ncbi:SsgA family sporulation/cell division regulator [Kitasatospora sp. NPDC003701]